LNPFDKFLELDHDILDKTNPAPWTAEEDDKERWEVFCDHYNDERPRVCGNIHNRTWPFYEEDAKAIAHLRNSAEIKRDTIQFLYEALSDLQDEQDLERVHRISEEAIHIVAGMLYSWVKANREDKTPSKDDETEICEQCGKPYPKAIGYCQGNCQL
jgi:hypothetical protein